MIYTGNIGLAQDIEKLILIAEHLKEYKNISFKIIGYGYQKERAWRVLKQSNFQICN